MNGSDEIKKKKKKTFDAEVPCRNEFDCWYYDVGNSLLWKNKKELQNSEDIML